MGVIFDSHIDATNRKIFLHILDVAERTLPKRYISIPAKVDVVGDVKSFVMFYSPGWSAFELRKVARGMTVTRNWRNFGVWVDKDTAYSTMAHEIVHVLLMPKQKYKHNRHGFRFKRCLRKLHKALNWDKPRKPF